MIWGMWRFGCCDRRMYYSASHHPSPTEQKICGSLLKKANKGGLRPNFFAVGGYDGMRVIYEAAQEPPRVRAVVMRCWRP